MLSCTRAGGIWSCLEESDNEDRTGGKSSTISTATLRPLLDLDVRPIKQVVYLRSYTVEQWGGLILGCVSHLDAFSASRVRS